MGCRVYPLRRRGRRLRWQEAQRVRIFEGELSSGYVNVKAEQLSWRV
jgi:hypothetical protein